MSSTEEALPSRYRPGPRGVSSTVRACGCGPQDVGSIPAPPSIFAANASLNTPPAWPCYPAVRQLAVGLDSKFTWENSYALTPLGPGTSLGHFFEASNLNQKLTWDARAHGLYLPGLLIWGTVFVELLVAAAFGIYAGYKLAVWVGL